MVITTPDRVQRIKEQIIAHLGREGNDSHRFHDKRMDLVKTDDKGGDRRTPLISISIGVVTNEKAVLTEEARQISEVAADTKRTTFSQKRES
jgi:hypothetical protein